MFQPDWLILRILHQSFEIERHKGRGTSIVIIKSNLSDAKEYFAPLSLRGIQIFANICRFNIIVSK